MSQRQDKYIASLLRAHHDDVLRHYRAARADVYTWQHRLHYDMDHAQRTLRNARDRVLLDLAQERNVAHVHWEQDEYVYDHGDGLTEMQEKRANAKLEAGEATVECYTVYVRDADGDWDNLDGLGGIWVEGDDDRREAEDDYIDPAPIREALYRHRACDDFGEFRQRWQPGRWVVE